MDPSNPTGRTEVEPYEQDAIKDAVTSGGNEEVEFLVKFQPYPGL